MWHYSFGDICTSRFWLSIARRPFAWWRWHVSFGPTYNGTTHGLLITTPLFVVIGHRRSVEGDS